MQYVQLKEVIFIANADETQWCLCMVTAASIMFGFCNIQDIACLMMSIPSKHCTFLIKLHSGSTHNGGADITSFLGHFICYPAPVDFVDEHLLWTVLASVMFS